MILADRQMINPTWRDVVYDRLRIRFSERIKYLILLILNSRAEKYISMIPEFNSRIAFGDTLIKFGVGTQKHITIMEKVS